MMLGSRPGGTGGFASIQSLTSQNATSPVGARRNSTPPPPPVPPPPQGEPIPIITGVVSGEAAQRVLSSHSVNFRSRASSPPSAPPPAPPPDLDSPKNPAAPLKDLHKGQLEAVAPPGCLVCKSQYKLITELRGFMCLCSPAITKSLKNLRRKNLWRRSKDRKSSRGASSRGVKTRAGLPVATSPPNQSGSQPSSKPANDVQPDRFGSSAPPSSISSMCSSPRFESRPPSGKLVIMVEDFYYGSAPGRDGADPGGAGLKFHCLHCSETLDSNIALMAHMQKHAWAESLQDGHADPSCPVCFRRFLSPVRLQRHMEAAHSQQGSTAQCRICEVDFSSEPDFLLHMKTTHKPGEMPYVCQVCDFRSSFYSDVWSHFETVHAGTKFLLCQYCLRVLQSNACYQQHFAKHQGKHVFSCRKCRLHFLFIKDHAHHSERHHGTHVRPPQLKGLQPGTKVTVRTYSLAAGSCDDTLTPCKVVAVDPPPPDEDMPKRKPVESLRELLSSLAPDSDEDDAPRPPRRCIECLSTFRDFRSHFPSSVRCSVCRFVTCCSTSYANHMISKHTTCRLTPRYSSLFRSPPRLSQTLRCTACWFTTRAGDTMANHVTDRPGHRCVMLTHSEPENVKPKDDSCSDTPSTGEGGGAFIPLDQLPSSVQTQNQLSVKALTAPLLPSSPPAMTIKFVGPAPTHVQHTLTASQFQAVLCCLCQGLPQASRCYQTAPQTVLSWVREQERRLLDRKWNWVTETLAEWVLSQREQQQNTSEGILLWIARRVLGGDARPLDLYSWTVDFLLRHDLGLQPVSADGHLGQLPKSTRDKSHAFTSVLSAQVASRAPHLVACMDEFSVYVNWAKFLKHDPDALQLFGAAGQNATFDIVLSALSDGTFLPPLLMHQGRSLDVPEGFPDNVLLATKGKAVHLECHGTWIEKVWRPHVASRGGTLLLADVHRGHLSAAFRSSLSDLSTSLFFIPSGCCCCLQPLHLCVTPVLGDFLQTRWTQLMARGDLGGLDGERLTLTLGCWLSEVSSTLNSDPEILRRSFASVGKMQEVETRREAARMIQTLTQSLTQPVEIPEPPAGPQPQLELLLVMKEDRKLEPHASDLQTRLSGSVPVEPTT
ncbi:pogo transposable element with ZNF domain isoform X2 [Antennarius striatus]